MVCEPSPCSHVSHKPPTNLHVFTEVCVVRGRVCGADMLAPKEPFNATPLWHDASELKRHLNAFWPHLQATPEWWGFCKSPAVSQTSWTRNQFVKRERLWFRIHETRELYEPPYFFGPCPSLFQSAKKIKWYLLLQTPIRSLYLGKLSNLTVSL